MNDDRPEYYFIIIVFCSFRSFSGAQIAELFLFVPICKELDADEFFKQHEFFGPLIYRFFAPLTIAATVVPLMTVMLNLIYFSDEYFIFSIMGVSTLMFFSTYFLYFKKANKKFADRELSNDELPSALQEWSNWHRGRIFFEAIAFACSIIALLRT